MTQPGGEMTANVGGQLSKDCQLDAQEMVRRAERAVGLVIRKGQAEGTIGTQAAGGWRARLQSPESKLKTSKELIGSGSQVMTDTYAMTDDVTDTEFDQALGADRKEGKLTRANVLRKIKREPSAKGHTADRYEYKCSP
jgi:hypothetical protein